jgi:hypothetical protein
MICPSQLELFAEQYNALIAKTANVERRYSGEGRSSKAEKPASCPFRDRRAAVAMTHGLTVVTADHHFADVTGPASVDWTNEPA